MWSKDEGGRRMILNEAIENAEEKAEEIRNEAEHYEIAGVNIYGCEERAQEWEQFAEWLKELKQLREQTRWIPVNKGLPKAEYGESDSVLVCFENETQDVLYFDGSNWRYPTGETYISVNHKNGFHNKVIAWMPLPEPYTIESEGRNDS